MGPFWGHLDPQTLARLILMAILGFKKIPWASSGVSGAQQQPSKQDYMKQLAKELGQKYNLEDVPDSAPGKKEAERRTSGKGSKSIQPKKKTGGMMGR